MFDNIGRKIKGLSAVICWVGIIASVFFGCVLWAYEYTVVLGVMLFFVGPLASWIGSFTLYGFGQLIDNSDKILRAIDPDAILGEEGDSFPRYELSMSRSMSICDYCDKHTEVQELTIVYPNDTRRKKVCMDCYNKKISENKKTQPNSDKLELLKKMKDSKLITEEEYRQKAEELLK